MTPGRLAKHSRGLMVRLFADADRRRAMMDPDVGRRKCLAVLGGTILWPLAARAQPGERVRRVGVLIYGRADNRGSRAQADSLRDGLQDLGWFEGRNLKIELRYNSDREHIHIGAE